MQRVFAIFVAAGCAAAPSGPSITFDACTTVRVGPGDPALDAALAMWRARGVTAFAAGEPADVTLVFEPAAGATYGFYDDTTATVYVNSNVTDPHQRAVTLAHELGHALGLPHVAADVRTSVMNPGNLTVEPTAEDAAALGACPD